MSEKWEDMLTAPTDGTLIQAEIPGHGCDNMIAYDEMLGAWYFVLDQEPPDDWTDGVCWRVNEDLRPSTPPVRWKNPPEPIEDES